MEEILHHLGCKKTRKEWDDTPINWCRISSINSSKWGAHEKPVEGWALARQIGDDSNSLRYLISRASSYAWLYVSFATKAEPIWRKYFRLMATKIAGYNTAVKRIFWSMCN